LTRLTERSNVCRCVLFVHGSLGANPLPVLRAASKETWACGVRRIQPSWFPSYTSPSAPAHQHNLKGTSQRGWRGHRLCAAPEGGRGLQQPARRPLRPAVATSHPRCARLPRARGAASCEDKLALDWFLCAGRRRDEVPPLELGIPTSLLCSDCLRPCRQEAGSTAVERSYFVVRFSFLVFFSRKLGAN